MFNLEKGDKVQFKDSIGIRTITGSSKIPNDTIYELQEHKLSTLTGFSLKFDKSVDYIQPSTLTIEKASDPDVVINVRSHEYVEYFCKWLDLHGKERLHSGSYLNNTSWDSYKNKMCYNINTGTYGDIEFYKGEDKIIIRFEPSMISNDKIWRKADFDRWKKRTEWLKNDPQWNFSTNPELNKKLHEIFEKSYKNLAGYINPYQASNKIKDIKFNKKQTFVKFADDTVEVVTLQHGDKYDQKQALLYAIAKHNGYGDKDLDELVAKFNPPPKKKEFVPHLKKVNGTFWGIIGEETNQEIAFGEKLFVGDIVEIYNIKSKREHCNLIVVMNEDCIDGIIFGVGDSVFKNGISTDNYWQIRKVKSYKDLEHNETIGAIIVKLRED